MKTKLLLTTVSAFFILHSAFAQGALTPTAEPAPTMKTLAQIEPRTDVSKLSNSGLELFLINKSGSYYLTTNLVATGFLNGITIATNNVTLDLNGFTVQGAPGSARGIWLNGGAYTNITVRNGSVSGWGGNGVDMLSVGNSRNVVLEDLTVAGNGSSGIYTGTASVVRDCFVQGNGIDGIYCFNGAVFGCVSRENGGRGIFANSGCVVRDCDIQSNGSYGIYVLSSTVTGCHVVGSGRSGIYVDAPGCVISGNTCKGNNTIGDGFEAGILINDANNRVEDNHVTANGHAGIQVVGYYSNVVIKNTVSGNTNQANNYLVSNPSVNALGPLITAGPITNSNPWANFSF